MSAARKGVQATARMLHRAGVTFGIFWDRGRESCTGDPRVRRLGNEYLYQEQTRMNIATLDEVGAKKIIASCPHCFNTIKNEYPSLGGNYEVIHHAELLEHLVRTGKLTPGTGYKGKVDSTTTPATWVGTTGSSKSPVRSSAPSPGVEQIRDAPVQGALAFAVVPGALACGWRRTSASESTWSAWMRRWAREPTSCRPPVPTA